MRTTRGIAWGAVLLVALMAAVTAEAAYPEKAVDVIAPASPGGGWDLTARLSTKVLKEAGIITQPLVVSNKVGGFGMVAMTDIVRNRRKDNHVILAFSAVLTTQMASNNNPYRWKDITPIASLFVDYGTIAVRKESKYTSMKDLAEDWKKNPNVLTFAGSSGPGGMDHMRVAMLAKTLGIPVKGVRYVAFPSGGEAMGAVLGGHTSAFVGEAGEIAGQVDSGNIRPLALLADQKLGGGFAQTPLAKDIGLDVVSPNWRGFYGPPEMSKDVVRFWEEALSKMVQTPAWKQVLQQQAWVPYYQSGEQFLKFLDTELAMYEKLAKELELVK